MWQEPRPEYTTLSHCWGDVAGMQPPQTTKANKRMHERGICFEILPKTFQHAVLITRRVGRSFLWIDSLAIVQDDNEDWELEAANMAAIFENSYLTIAATTSKNCEGGCSLDPFLNIVEGTTTLQNALPFPKTSHEVRPLCTVSAKQSSISGRYRAKLKLLTRPKYDLPPLHKRGWVMQELFLSRRIIHMTTNYMLWECQATYDFEDAERPQFQGNQGIQPPAYCQWRLPRVKNNIEQLWWDLAETYARSDFTRMSDRAPALAGIIQYQAAKVKDVPLLGLWKNTIARDLGWSYDHRFSETIPGMPSWTWLSQKGYLTGPIEMGIRKSLKFQLRLLRWDIGWVRQPYVSHFQGGHLSVASRTFESTVTIDKDQDGPWNGTSRCIANDFRDRFLRRHPLLTLDCAQIMDRGPVFFPDCAFEVDEPVAITYLLLEAFSFSDDAHVDEEIRFLVLRKESDHSSAYRRVGFGFISVPSKPYSREEDTSNATPFIDMVLEKWIEASVVIG